MVFQGGSLSGVSLAHRQTGRRPLALPGRRGADAVLHLTSLHPNHTRVNAISEYVNAVSFMESIHVRRHGTNVSRPAVEPGGVRIQAGSTVGQGVAEQPSGPHEIPGRTLWFPSSRTFPW